MLSTSLDPMLEQAIREHFTPIPHVEAGSRVANLLAQFPQNPSAEFVPLLCDALYYHRQWDGVAPKPQQWILRWAVEAILPRFASKDLSEFWNRLQSSHEPERTAMELGLELLTAQHALEHLLFGLEFCRQHEARAKIVRDLEKVGDSSVLPRLFLTYRHSAEHDWALGRQIERALRSILDRTDVETARTLLRSSHEPYEELLRNVAKPHSDTTGLLKVPTDLKLP